MSHSYRSILLYILTAIALLFCYGSQCLYAQKGGNNKFTIVLDAGHGGHDPGALGKFSKEKNINLKVVLEVGRLLKSNCPDVKVIYTRSTDVYLPLKTRADIANRNKADLFISVHTNAAPRGNSARGTETYTLGMARATANLEVAKRENAVITYEKGYQETYEGFDPNKAESYIIFELMQDRYMKQSVDLARYIQQQYVSCGRHNRGVHQAGLLVLLRSTMPAVLTELGFISNPGEEQYLNSTEGVQELARSIYNGIVKYRKQHTGNKGKMLSATPTKEAETDNASPEKQEADETKSEKDKDKKEPDTQVATAQAGQPTFKVQIHLSNRKLKADNACFKNLSPIDCYEEGGYYKYTYGESTNYNEIRRVHKTVTAKFPQSFIVSFIDGKRTNLAEAIKLSKKQR